MSTCEHDGAFLGADGYCVLCPAPVSKQTQPVTPVTGNPGALAITDETISMQDHLLHPTLSSFACCSVSVSEPTIQQILATLCRRDLTEFVRQAHASRSSKPLVWGPHLDLFCLTVQCMAEEWFLLHGLLDVDPVFKIESIERLDRAWALHGLVRAEHPGELLVQNVTINAPPGCLKSEIVMVYFPAWLWLWCPWLKLGCASAILKNVTRDSDAMHDLVVSEWYRETFATPWQVTDTSWEVDGELVANDSIELRPPEGSEIRSDIDAKGKWANAAGGERQSVTMYQGFTGQHVHFLFGDDCDDPDKVWSDSVRTGTHDRFARVFENRVDEESSALRFIVQQQTHPDDLSNHLRALSPWAPSNRMGWAHLCVPLIWGKQPANYSNRTPHGHSDARAIGEKMDPTRNPDRVLADKRRKLGTSGFEAQYNQNAAPSDGGWFKLRYFRFFDLLDEPLVKAPRDEKMDKSPALGFTRDRITGRYPFGRVVLSIDASMGTEKETSSECGLVVIGLQGPHRRILDDRSDVMNEGKLITACREIVASWTLTDVLIEQKALGHELHRKLMDIMANGELQSDGKRRRWLGPDGKVARFRIETYTPPPHDSKTGRARAMLPDWEAGFWSVREGAPWVPRLMQRFSRFPNAQTKDDTIDCCSQVSAHYDTEDVLEKLRQWR